MNASQKLMLAQKLSGFDGNLGIERASTIPKLWYLDDLIYQAEREAVFGDSWLVACRLDQVSKPGEFVTTEIAGEPLIVIRGAKDMQLHAFSNVCRHRAAKVEAAPCGVATRLSCHYHNWTYDANTGKLLGAPEFNKICNFRKEDNGLPSWSVDSWGPYVFVRAPWAKSTESLLEHLKPLPALYGGLGIEKLKFVRRKEYVLECNWKGFVDNYLDGCYHCRTIHPRLFCAIDYKNYKSSCEHNTVVQTSPLKVAADAGVSSVRKGAAYYSWVCPNLMLNAYEGVLDTNLVLPLGPNRCRVIFDFFFENTDGPEQQALIEKSIALAHEVQMEDAGVCEEVQAGLASASFDSGRFSVRREAGGYHFHKLLAAKLQALAATK